MSIYRIGLIGLGGMAQSHIKGMKQVPGMMISAICDVSPDALAAVGEQLDIPAEQRFTDFNRLIEDDKVDAVVSITPNVVHAEIMKGCLRAGKPFLSEKPFAMTYREAQDLLPLYEMNRIPAMIGFSYRYTPAFRFSRKWLKEGKIGAVRSFSVQYLQDWGSAAYNCPFLWRFDKKVTGTGTLGDLGSHMIDLAHYLIGPFDNLSAQLETLIRERKSLTSDDMLQVEVDDYAGFQARMENGAAGIFHTTRNALGSGNQLEISLFGDHGTLHASTLRPDELVWIHIDEVTGDIVEERMRVPNEVRRTQWEDFARLLSGFPGDGLPDFMDGYRNQRVLEAIVLSDRLKKRISLNDPFLLK